MNIRLRRAPDAEWVLMYRLGLSRKSIAALVRVPPAAVGYHLVIARRQDPGLEAEHQAAAGAAPVPYPSLEDFAAWKRSSRGWRLKGGSQMVIPATWAKGLSLGGCPDAGAKQPKAPWTRHTATFLPRCRGGPKTTGK